MAHYHTAEELDATTVKIQNGGSMQTYKKADLVVSKTHFGVYLKNKNVPTDAIVASWNTEQAFDYGYLSLTALENYLLNLLYGTAIPVAITSYTAGLSTIDFTNKGGDDWDVDFYITPTSVQIPTGYSIVGFSAHVTFWSNGIATPTGYTNQTTDLTVSQSGLGAGVYQITQIFSVSNGVDTKSFVIGKLVKVDGVGGIIAQIDAEGITVNSINGLTINATVHINQVGCNYPFQWLALDNTYTPLAVLGSNITQIMVLPTSTTSLGVSLILDSVFTNDFTGMVGATSTITIQ